MRKKKPIYLLAPELKWKALEIKEKSRKKIFFNEAQKATFTKIQAEFLRKICFDYPELKCQKK